MHTIVTITAIKRFELYVVNQRKLMLFSWGDIDYTIRISAHVRIKHVFSMNFTHFHEVFLQQWFCTYNRPNGSKYANTERARVYRAFVVKKCL